MRFYWALLWVSLWACTHSPIQRKIASVDPSFAVFQPATWPPLQSENTEIVPVQNAQVVIMDPNLLQTHFSSLENLSPEELKTWFLNQSAWIRKTHLHSKTVNTSFKTNPLLARQAKVPPEYGRAFVIPVHDPTKEVLDRVGYFDIKGSGAMDPRPGAYTNGLMTLGEALREYLMEHMVRRVLAHSGIDVTNLGSYGVIDLGFNLFHGDGTQSRAGLYVRPAHSNRNFDHVHARKLVEETLKRYGILVEAPQGTSLRQLIDFGSYTVRRPEKIGANPQLAINFERWGIDESKVPEPGREQFFWGKWEQPWYRMHDLAEDLARGRKTVDEVESAVKSWVDEVDQKLFGRTWGAWSAPERLKSPPLPCSVVGPRFLK